MEKDNSLLFFEFLRANGFDPNNYEKVLELLQSAGNSLSKYLLYFDQYLLSLNVKYDELYIYGLQGDCGYLDENGIFIDKSSFNDEYYSINKVRKIYSMDEFGSIICYHEDFDSEIKNIVNMFKYPQDKFFGFVVKKSDEKLKSKLGIYKTLLEGISCYENKKYEIVHDSISSLDKEFYLVRRKSIR